MVNTIFRIGKGACALYSIFNVESANVFLIDLSYNTFSSYHSLNIHLYSYNIITDKTYKLVSIVLVDKFIHV